MIEFVIGGIVVAGIMFAVYLNWPKKFDAAAKKVDDYEDKVQDYLEKKADGPKPEEPAAAEAFAPAARPTRKKRAAKKRVKKKS